MSEVSERRRSRVRGGDRSGARVVLYSGGQEPRNSQIHESLLDLVLGRSDAGRRSGERAVRMTYVPFTQEGAASFYHRFVRRYRAYGAREFDCIAADDPRLRSDRGWRREALARLERSDIIYLPGGNTFYFLHHLRRGGLLPVLRRFGERGGVVAGLSAGAHLITPHIALAGHPKFDCDDNEVDLSPRRFSALGLVRFEFFPHYRDSSRYRQALRAYSRRSSLPLYACRDGSGVVVQGDRFVAHGDVWLFDRGRDCKIAG